MATISLVLPDLRTGGAERNCLILADQLLRLGHDVDIVLLQNQGALLKDVPDGVHIVSLEVARIRDSVRPFARYIDSRRPDAVLANMWPVTVATIIARLFCDHRSQLAVVDRALLSRGYADYGLIHRAILRASISLSYRLADARIGVSRGVVNDLSRLSGISTTKFDVVYNPVRRIEVSSDEDVERTERCWKEIDGHRILTVGTLKAVKNHNLLIRAFAKMKECDRAALMILGDGPLRDELRKLAEREGVTERVLMPGFFMDPMPFYRSADLFVLSSNHEGFGNVIVESLASGTPVVSTDCPSGPREILANGEYGALVPVGDVNLLADAMDHALLSVHDTEALRIRAADFSAEANARSILSVFDL